MKKIYTLLSIMLIGVQVSNAQLTLTKAANEPVIGDMANQADYDSTTVIPKGTGAGMSWNFTSATPGTFTETITYTTVASTPSAAVFAGESYAMVRGGSNYEYYKSSTNMLEHGGMHDPSGNDMTVWSNRPTWILWPTSFGTSNTDAFAGLQTVGTNTASWNGTITYTATGSGTVTLPNGNVHPNCLQVKRSISLTVTSGTNTPSQMSLIQYEYWSNLYKHPILTVEYQTVTSGTNISKGYSIYANTNALTIGINEKDMVNATVLVYPNPANDLVNVSLADGAVASSIEVIDVAGRTVAVTENSNSIDVSTLAKSVYTIKVTNKEAVLKKKLIISE